MPEVGNKEDPLYLDYESPDFWKDRLSKAKEPQLAVWSCSLEERTRIRDTQAELIKQVLSLYSADARLSLLDAGCGVGELLSMLPSYVKIDYTGVDVSPDFIEICKETYPSNKFYVENLRHLSFKDKQFDLAIGISIEGPIQGNLGEETWTAIETELLRVSKTVYLINLVEPITCRAIQSPVSRVEDIFRA